MLETLEMSMHLGVDCSMALCALSTNTEHASPASSLILVQTHSCANEQHLLVGHRYQLCRWCADQP